MLMTGSLILFLFLTETSKALNHSNRTALSHRKLQSSTFSTAITKLTASNGGSSNFFGDFNQVAIDNNRIVVGAFGFNNFQGTAYLFGDPKDPQSGRSFSELAALTINGGASNDRFGVSVAMDNDIIVVGAIGESFGKGAVYVYNIVENNGVISVSQVTKLMASVRVDDDRFGISVAIHGIFIIVGADLVEKTDNTPNVGAAYLFVNLSNNPNTSPQWTQIQKLQPSDLTAIDQFGWSVAMDENIAVVGTFDPSNANAAYVFAPVDPSLLSSTWTQMAKLTGSANSNFGYSVALTTNVIVVGAFDDDTKSTNAGAAFVFTKTSSSSLSSWSQMTQLLAADGAVDDFFGVSVAISRDASSIVVGAVRDDFNTAITNSGSAYLFQLSETSTTTAWTQMEKFVAADTAPGDFLGISIAIENNIVVVGASGDDSSKGSAYVIQTAPDPSKTNPKKSFCFSPVNTVFVKGRGTIPMQALKVGDWVQTNIHPEPSFSRVLSFVHIDRDATVEYLQLFMEHKEYPLEVSNDHLLIQEPNRKVIRAQDVRVGDMLQSGNKVIHISTVQRHGLYAPVTESGTILVSGVTASCYVHLLTAITPRLQAPASHAALTPLRFLCTLRFSLCENETYSLDGYSSNLSMLVQFGLQLSTWNGIFQWLVVVLFAPLLVGFLALETFVTTNSGWLFVAPGSVVGGLCYGVYYYKLSKKSQM